MRTTPANGRRADGARSRAARHAPLSALPTPQAYRAGFGAGLLGAAGGLVELLAGLNADGTYTFTDTPAIAGRCNYLALWVE